MLPPLQKMVGDKSVGDRCRLQEDKTWLAGWSGQDRHNQDHSLQNHMSAEPVQSQAWLLAGEEQNQSTESAGRRSSRVLCGPLPGHMCSMIQHMQYEYLLCRDNWLGRDAVLISNSHLTLYGWQRSSPAQLLAV